MGEFQKPWCWTICVATLFALILLTSKWLHKKLMYSEDSQENTSQRVNTARPGTRTQKLTQASTKDEGIVVSVCELDTLSANFDNVAVVNALRQAAYAKGFTDGTLLREFCEDYVPEPYFPMADTRPTAERLGWPPMKT